MRILTASGIAAILLIAALELMLNSSEEESSRPEAGTATPPPEGSPAQPDPSPLITTLAEEESGNAEIVANFDLEVFQGAGIARAHGGFYIVDSEDDKVYAYGTDGVRDPAADFDLDGQNGDATSITHVDDRFYVLDAEDDKVYAYSTDGVRDPDAEFTLDGQNGYAASITHVNGRFYMVSYDRVYVYGTAGVRDPDADFDLPDADYLCNSHDGIEYANGRLYVLCQQPGVMNFGLVALAFSTDGALDEDASFQIAYDFGLSGHGLTHFDGKLYVLDDRAVAAYAIDSAPPDLPRLDAAFGYGGNNGATDVVYARSRFYVVDAARDKVYAYGADGFRNPSADFDLDVRNGAAQGITYAAGRFYVVDSSDDKVFAYGPDGARNPNADFELGIDNEPTGITYAEGRFYVVVQLALARGAGRQEHDKVYAYGIDGVRDPHADFDLDDDSYYPADIVYAAGRFYVVDHGGMIDEGSTWTEQKVYAYSIDGTRDPGASFDLCDSIATPQGITHVNGVIYLLDGWDDKVYACGSSGLLDRDPESGFYLADENRDPRGIAYAADRCYVIDSADGTVYAYGIDGTRDRDAEFTLTEENRSPQGITYAADRFYVVEGWRVGIYAYGIDGTPDPRGRIPIDDPRENPTGIAHAAGGFYVVDRGRDGRQGTDAEVYAYHRTEGTLPKRDSAPKFDFDGHNRKPSGITHADGRFFVVDSEDDKVYAYRTDGF